jgi:hypothetical protein
MNNLHWCEHCVSILATLQDLLCDRELKLIVQPTRSKVGSANSLQRNCDFARRDGTNDAWMRRMALFGSSGRRTDNMERDLWRFVAQKGLRLDINFYYVQVAVRRPDNPALNRYVRHPCILPHEFVGLLYREGRLLETLCPNGLGEVAQFWSHLATEEWVQEHPVDPGARPNCIPLAVYGDDAPYTKSNSLLILRGRGS